MTDLNPLQEGMRLSKALDAAITELKAQVADAAMKERDYRLNKSLKFIEAKVRDGLAKEKEAWVDAETANERMARDVAEGMRQATMEEVRNLRGQLSFVQTYLNAQKADFEFHKNGQTELRA